MIHLQVTVANAAELLATQAYGAGALLRWESGALQAGPFVEGGTVALVSGTSLYDVWDAAGVVGTWYRTRISNSGGTTFSAYSAPFQGGISTTAATLDDFLAGFEGPAPVAARYGRILDCLAQAHDTMLAEIGFDFTRHPAISGDEQRLFDGRIGGHDGGRYSWVGGEDRIHIHLGIVSVTLIEARWTLVGPWVAMDPADWYLDPATPEIGESYDHIVLSQFGKWPVVPPGQRTIRVTGAFGYATPPVRIKAGELALARQLYRADSTMPGGQAGPDEWSSGSSVMPRGWPDATYRAIAWYRSKFNSCRV